MAKYLPLTAVAALLVVLTTPFLYAQGEALKPGVGYFNGSEPQELSNYLAVIKARAESQQFTAQTANPDNAVQSIDTPGTYTDTCLITVVYGVTTSCFFGENQVWITTLDVLAGHVLIACSESGHLCGIEVTEIKDGIFLWQNPAIFSHAALEENP
jgi:hypothetical protein